MTKATVTVRTLPGGVASSGLAYEIRREVDNVQLTTGTTDANGQFTYAPNLSPGPWRWVATDTVPAPDVIRSGSSKSAGSGGCYSLYEVPIALRSLLNGVVEGYANALAITDPDSGPNLAYNTGAVLIKGIPGVVYSSGTHAVATAQDATNTKACYIGIELTGQGQTEEGKMVWKDYCGAAAGSPSLPSLAALQTETSYFLPLASFILGNSAASNANDVTTLVDLRTYIGRRNPMVSAIARRTNIVTPDTTTSTTGATITWSSGSTDLTLLSDVTYDVEAWGAVLVKVTAGQTVSVAPFINGTSNTATYIDTDRSADYWLVENEHALVGSSAVVGSGAAISCGLRWKVSGGTGSVLTGIFVARAIPRT